MEEAHGLLERQVAEIEAVQASFPEEGAFRMDAGEEAALEEARGLVEVGAAALAAGGEGGPTLSFTLCVPGAELLGCAVELRVRIPRGYPERELPELTPRCAEAGRGVHDEISGALRACCEECAGGECLLQAAYQLQEAVEAIGPVLLEEARVRAGSGGGGGGGGGVRGTGVPSIGRTAIWFHHIKSTQKRKHILEWASELRLGGFSKPGYPGAIIVEGGAGDVADFVARLRALQWKAMAVRAEEVEELVGEEGDTEAKLVDAARLLQKGWSELDETGGMSVLAEECRNSNLEHLFLSIMKLGR